MTSGEVGVHDIGDLRFHSIQLYTGSMETLDHYKAMSDRYNEFSAQAEALTDIEAGRKLYTSIFSSEPPTYSVLKQDPVQQLISGLGWRITAHHESAASRSLLINSSDGKGVRFIITHAKPQGEEPATKKQRGDEFDHFSAANANRFHDNHAGRGGVGVLAFEVGEGVSDKIKARYMSKHPTLFKGEHSYLGGTFKVLETFAYYNRKGAVHGADEGTVLRFIERSGSSSEGEGGAFTLPGFEPVQAVFGIESSAYFDHWVSNVIDRLGFINTMTDCLGFTPKVDFNAGVVAAGEAQIESTVIGNAPSTSVTTPAEALVNQQQVYLPINNALSEVGHVHLYLEEIGQGIQHIASRVSDLVSFIGRTNKFRAMSGNGFDFLQIPRSYYGVLTARALVGTAGLQADKAATVMATLQKCHLASKTGVITIDITDDEIASALSGADLGDKLAGVQLCVRRSRFANLAALLGDALGDDTLLRIVKNKILVDIQDSDVLYQIFTAPILRAESGHEAPFLEFIQRVCSERTAANGQPRPIRPGCGGFGIRNFLTLFLSIEVSKAMKNAEAADAAGDEATCKFAEEQVLLFTNQLNDSNPILTAISDAMTLEGDCRTSGDAAGAAAAAARKQAAQDALQVCSTSYKNQMRALRERGTASK